MNALKSVVNRLESRIEEVVCSPALSAIAICVFLQVVMRYVFGTALQWSGEVSGICMVWAVYMGASLCVRERFHIRILAGVTAMQRGAAKPVILLADILCCAFCVFMIVIGTEYLSVLAQLTARTSSLGIDEFYPKSIIVIGYTLILVRLLQIYFGWFRDGAKGSPGMRPEHDLVL